MQRPRPGILPLLALAALVGATGPLALRSENATTAVLAAAAGFVVLGLAAVHLRELRSLAVDLDVRGAVFALFLTAGYIKADERIASLPVDLTATMAVLLVILTAIAVFRHGFVLKHLAWVAGLFGLFAFAVVQTDLSGYGGEKISRLLTLTSLAAVAPFAILHDPTRLRRFLNALAVVGLILAASGWLALLFGDATARLTAFGSNTIALGRATGMTVVWVAALALAGRISLPVSAGLIAIAGVPLVASGSRGPLFIALGALAAAGLLSSRVAFPRLPRLLGVLLIVTASLALAFATAPQLATERIGLFLGGELDRSGLLRVEIADLSWERIQTTPFGIGWGGFASTIDYIEQYPHNILLEVALEAGWLAAAILIGAFCVAASRLSRATPELGIGPLAVCIFAAGNAFVSGDVNDNRLFFVMVAVGLAIGSQPVRGSLRKVVSTRIPGVRTQATTPHSA
jgi:O-antigen ligase/polysaccharide polymerase Wzy-like membrane protein